MNIFIKYQVVLFFISITLQCFSQIQNSGIPYSKKYLLNNDVPVINMRQLSPSDTADKNDNKKKAYTYAVVFDVNINPDNSGIWNYIDNNKLVWRIGIQSEGAYSINIIIDPFDLPENANLYVYNKGYNFIAGAFNYLNNNKNNYLAIMPVPGDIIYVELNFRDESLKNLKFNISKVSHDYKNIYNYANEKKLKAADLCEVDVNCDYGLEWQDTKNAVFRMLFLNSLKQKYEYCTGTLINNANYETIPYFITAYHCLFNTEGANSLIALFDYESYYCGGDAKDISKTLSGATIVASSQEFDFTLGRLNQMPPDYYKPYFAGWNTEDTAVMHVTSIHHPSGDVKKISIDFDSIYPYEYIGGKSMWRVEEWDVGVTEPGSSGACLFNQNQEIIGILSMGDASCSFPYNDLFMKFSYLYNYYNDINKQLKVYLNPSSKNIKSLKGTNPYSMSSNICDTFTYVTNSSNSVILSNDSIKGYYTGQNKFKYTGFAQLFKNDEQILLSEFFINTGPVTYSDKSTVIFKIWEKGTDNYPSYTIHEIEFLYKNLVSNSLNIIELKKPILIKNDYFIGYEIKYNEEDTFTIKQSTNTLNDDKNYYVFQNAQWQRIDKLTSGLVKGSLDIKSIICSAKFNNEKLIKSNDKYLFEIYPNPAKEYLNIELNEALTNNINLYIYDITGKPVKYYNITPEKKLISLNIKGLKKGMYLIKFQVDNQNYSKKFLIQ